MAYFNKRYHPPGTPPGTLTKSPEGTGFTLAALDFSPAEVHECKPATLAECRALLDSPSATWIHVQGNVAPETLRELGEIFGLHPLALEDVLNTGQRPKMDVYDRQVFVVMAMPEVADRKVKVDQFSAFLGERFLITFHTGASDPFESVRKRMQTAGNKVRGRGTDYLLYTLLDMVVDHGFPILEAFGDEVQGLEEEVLGRPNGQAVHRIHALRRELVLLRRTLWPQREVVNGLLRDESDLLGPETRIYLRDCYDHAVQLIDLLESYRDVLASLLDVYYSVLSMRLNDIMRVLTLIATIFIPLTFIVGIYGMNFEYMPELHWRFGYPLVLAGMLLIAVGMLYYFRRKRWL
jgi:magnesium transporter